MSKPGSRYEITAIRRARCPLCGAVPGQWCISRSDKSTPVAHPHAERVAEVLAARRAERERRA